MCLQVERCVHTTSRSSTGSRWHCCQPRSKVYRWEVVSEQPLQDRQQQQSLKAPKVEVKSRPTEPFLTKAVEEPPHCRLVLVMSGNRAKHLQAPLARAVCKPGGATGTLSIETKKKGGWWPQMTCLDGSPHGKGVLGEPGRCAQGNGVPREWMYC